MQLQFLIPRNQVVTDALVLHVQGVVKQFISFDEKRYPVLRSGQAIRWVIPNPAQPVVGLERKVQLALTGDYKKIQCSVTMPVGTRLANGAFRTLGQAQQLAETGATVRPKPRGNPLWQSPVTDLTMDKLEDVGWFLSR